MFDLDFFRTHQDKAPAWAVLKHPGISSFNSQSLMGMNIGSNRVLCVNASVVIPDPGQPMNQTVIWGQKIEIPKDKSHLIVDGVRMELSHLAATVTEDQALSELLANRFSRTSMSSSLFASQASRATHESLRENHELKAQIKASQQQFKNEIVEKYFGKGGFSGMSMMETEMAVTNSDGTYTLTFKAGMMMGKRANGEAVTVKDINESKTLSLAATVEANSVFASQ